jgi:glutamate-1-semialdehyde 2,1-aminomutase
MQSRLGWWAAWLTELVTKALASSGKPVRVNRVGSMFTIFFTDGPVKDHASARRADPAIYGEFFGRMLDRGVLLAPSQWEAGFLSLSHDDEVIQRAMSEISDEGC